MVRLEGVIVTSRTLRHYNKLSHQALANQKTVYGTMNRTKKQSRIRNLGKSNNLDTKLTSKKNNDTGNTLSETKETPKPGKFILESHRGTG